MDKPEHPEMWILLVDSTAYWDESVTKHAGRIFDAYLLDKTVGYHLCSLSQSFECHFIRSFCETPRHELPREVASDIESADIAEQRDVKYYNAYNVEAAEEVERAEPIPDGRLGKFKLSGWDWEYIEENTRNQEDFMNIAVQAVIEGGL